MTSIATGQSDMSPSSGLLTDQKSAFELTGIHTNDSGLEFLGRTLNARDISEMMEARCFQLTRDAGTKGAVVNDDLDDMEERLQSPVTKDIVEARVEDWKNRLRALFRQVTAWASENGWNVDDSGTVGMHEEIMQKFGVPATEQPTLRLDGEQGYVLFKPKGLWVIGANGRIDLYTSKGTFIIVDLAETGCPPTWTIFRATQKRDGDQFTPEMLASLV